MIFRTPFFLPWLYPGLTWRIPTGDKEIYLTLDDGPIPGVTEFVLRELEKVKAKATFFCIGDNVRKHPSIFKKIIENGHAIGNHTFHHLKGWNHGLAEFVENILLCEKEISFNGTPDVPGREAGGKGRALFRPPYGRIKREQIKALTAYKIIMWDVLSHDYSGNLSPERCLRGSVRATRPGSIVVFHDSLKAEKNMTYALPRFLDHFANRGYSFKAIPNS